MSAVVQPSCVDRPEEVRRKIELTQRQAEHGTEAADQTQAGDLHIRRLQDIQFVRRPLAIEESGPEFAARKSPGRPDSWNNHEAVRDPNWATIHRANGDVNDRALMLSDSNRNARLCANSHENGQRCHDLKHRYSVNANAKCSTMGSNPRTQRNSFRRSRYATTAHLTEEAAAERSAA